MEIAKQIKQGIVTLKIHSNEYNGWCRELIKFNHPMTFNTCN